MLLLYWNKIIRRLTRFLTHSPTEIDEKKINLLRCGVQTFKIENEYYLLKKNDITYRLRKNSSDVDVYKQIVINKEYQIIIDYFILNQINPKFIIDCGANIGLTSLQIAKHYPTTKIIAVEPDLMNFQLLKENSSQFKNIQCLNNAIWSHDTIVSISNSFRDGRDWSISTTNYLEKSSSKIQTVTLENILEKCNFDIIDFLKIDIEGAEKELFSSKNYYSFLDKVSCIAIEIHDEVVDRKLIEDILANKSFTLFNSGELTIGFKK